MKPEFLKALLLVVIVVICTLVPLRHGLLGTELLLMSAATPPNEEDSEARSKLTKRLHKRAVCVCVC